MARREEAEMNQVRDRYLDLLLQVEFRLLSFTDQAKELGVSSQTVANWRKAISPERWKEIQRMTDLQVPKQSIEINDALYLKAKSQDVPAIKLWKESREGWSPTQINKNLNKDADLEGLSTEELTEKALAGIPAEILERVLERKKVKSDPGTGAQ